MANAAAAASRFQGKVCLVTGGGSGIGRAACLRFAEEGGAVAVVGQGIAKTRAVAEEIAAMGGRAVGLGADVSNGAEVARAVEDTVAAFGRLDVIVNCAAVMTFTPLVETSEEDFDRVLAVNLRSVFLLARHGVPRMGEGGAIVNVSSVHAHATTANVVPYAASKGGMEALTRGLSIELEARGIRVNAIAPGAVDTPMLWENPNVKSGAEKITGAVGKPEDLAAAIAFLASSDAAFVTGATLVADGGRLGRL